MRINLPQRRKDTKKHEVSAWAFASSLVLTTENFARRFISRPRYSGQINAEDLADVLSKIMINVLNVIITFENFDELKDFVCFSFV